MSKVTIWGNMIVKNEDQFIWFSIKSVIDYLDKILIWDTGSKDDTVKIIKLLQQEYPKKVIFEEVGDVDVAGLTKKRQQMLDQTKSDWLLLVDGDEVWWKDSLEKTIDIIQNEKIYAVVTPIYNLIGDIYHYQEESAGDYKILGRKGHFNIRFINRTIPGLHLENDYPLEGYYDNQNRLIQNIEEKLKFIDGPLMHFSHLQRSSLSSDKKMTLHRNKVKYEIGKRFDKDFNFPEALYLSRPKIISSPWERMKKEYRLKAGFQTPLKKIKRKIFTK